jgi:hypothetical protein
MADHARIYFDRTTANKSRSIAYVLGGELVWGAKRSDEHLVADKIGSNLATLCCPSTTDHSPIPPGMIFSLHRDGAQEEDFFPAITASIGAALCALPQRLLTTLIFPYQ